MRRLILILLAIVALAGFTWSWAKDIHIWTEFASQKTNIILIGWDGIQRNHLRELLEQERLPHLRELSSQGALVAIDILRTTDSKAGWAQILTGYEPEITGVYSNTRYQRIPAGYTVFERLEKGLNSQDFAAAAVIGRSIEAILPQTQDTMGKERFFSGLLNDEAVGNQVLSLLEEYKDKQYFIFAHFEATDLRGHLFGENSQAYDEGIIAADAWLGKILAKIEETGVSGHTLVYVTADHGFDEDRKTHHDAPYVFLATNDPLIKRRGLRVDITPTILHRFGLDPSLIEPPLDGHTLAKPYRPPDW